MSPSSTRGVVAPYIAIIVLAAWQLAKGSKMCMVLPLVEEQVVWACVTYAATALKAVCMP
jgi:hypothetical protein